MADEPIRNEGNEEDERTVRIEKGEDGGFRTVVPKYARYRAYEKESVFSLPATAGHAWHRFAISHNNVRELDDGSLDISVDAGEQIMLIYRGERTYVSAEDLAKEFDGAKFGDFKTVWHSVEIPRDAVWGSYPTCTRLIMPEGCPYPGRFAVISNAFKKNDLAGDEDKLYFRIPDNMDIIIRDSTKAGYGGGEYINGKEFAEYVKDADFKKRTEWVTLDVPKNAFIHRYDKSTIMKMPNGAYSGYIYYLPNGMVVGPNNGSYTLRIPKDRTITVKNSCTGEREEFNIKQFENLVRGKGADRYLQNPAWKGLDEKFQTAVEAVKGNAPDEMMVYPNWVGVKITKKEGSAVSEHAVATSAFGDGSEAAAKNIGGSIGDVADILGSRHSDTLGFCFDGKGVCCLEMPGCLDEAGNPATENAKKLLKAASCTYTEKTPDGRGIRVFGMTAETPASHISKDRDAELYSGCGFVALTGSPVCGKKELASFDDGELGEFVNACFGTGEAAGELTDKDRDIVKRLSAGEQGGRFSALYSGESPFDSEDTCAVSLAMRASCATLGDIDAVRRIYNSSERKNKDPEYVDHLAMRAVKYTEPFVRKVSDEAATRGEKATGSAPDGDADDDMLPF